MIQNIIRYVLAFAISLLLSLHDIDLTGLGF